MKIKDIITDIKTARTRAYTALRISRSSSKIKQAIVRMQEDDILPNVSVTLDFPNSEDYIKLSSVDLVEKYEMGGLEALLFLDTLERLQTNREYDNLREMITSLTNGKHDNRVKYTADDLEYIKVQSPEVWEEFRKLCEKKENRDSEIIKLSLDLEEQEI